MQRTSAYSIDEIKRLAVVTSTWRGWDLLRLHTKRAETPWNMADIAKSILTGSETVLDAGCGDGRLLAALAKSFTRGIGVDVSKARVHYARMSLPMRLRTRVHFTRASSHAVPAPNGAFHLVLNRHSPLFPEEIDRLLAPGGILVTQQKGEQDARAIVAAFDETRQHRNAGYRGPDEVLLPRTFELLSSRGYSVIRSEQYDVPFVFENVESLLFWLQAVPVPPDFDADRDAETVLEILDRIGTPAGVVTNEHRHLLVMQKPRL